MHKYVLHYFAPIYLFIGNGTCGLQYKEYDLIAMTDMCKVLEIPGKYNLTLELEYHRFINFNGQISGRSFGRATPYVEQYNEMDDSIYQVVFYSLNFITVTNPPSANSGLDAFISPFDSETWAFLFITVVTLGGFVSGLGQMDSVQHGCLVLVSIVEKVISVTSVLLGQVSDTTGKAYRTAKVASLLIILWLFGNLVLTANLYQGSIYSCLAVILPPQTPLDFDDLVTWDLAIISDARGYDYGTQSRMSILVFTIIPELLSTPGISSKFAKLRKTLQARVTTSQDPRVYKMIKNSVRENSTRSHPTFVIILPSHDIGNTINGYKLAGNRYIVASRLASPFSMVMFFAGYRNLVHPYFVKDWRRIQESGLESLWDTYIEIGRLLNRISFHQGKQKYFETVQRSFSDVKETIRFHESTPVSVYLIRPIFAICGIILVLGMLGFLAENRNNVVAGVKLLVQAMHATLIYIWKVFQTIVAYCLPKTST